MYTYGKADGLTKEFLDFMTSEEVQKKVVTHMGYIPMTEMKVVKSHDGKVSKK